MKPEWSVQQFADNRQGFEVRTEIVVVGSGAGGGSIAAELAEGGLDVVILEEGAWWGTQDYEIDAGRMIQTLYRDAGTSQIYGRPNIGFAEGRAVGGSTIVNGGMCWRAPEKILDKWRLENGLWDLTPAKMEPIFARVESRYNVNQQIPESLRTGQHMFADTAEKIGWYAAANPRNQEHCTGSNLCTLGCPTGAKQTILQTYIPRALDAGAQLFTHCRVDKITMDGSRATGVEGSIVDQLGRSFGKFKVIADKVISCCGANHTPALLHRSGIRHKRLGHNLQCHPNSKVIGLYDRTVEHWQGVHQSHQIHEFWDEGIVLATGGVPPAFVAMGSFEFGHESMHLMDHFSQMMITGALIEDSGRGRLRFIKGQPIATYTVNDVDFYKFQRSVALLATLHFEAGAKAIHTPFLRLPIIESVEQIPRIFERGIRKSETEMMTVHLMGTASMDADPSRGVCNPFGQVFGTQNVFVADGSLFPSPVGVNPQETIIALATRTAFYLLDCQDRKPTDEPGAAARRGDRASRVLSAGGIRTSLV